MKRFRTLTNQNSFFNRLVAQVVQVLFLTSLWDGVDATCLIKDASDRKTPLNMLPDGVDYSNEFNRLRCMTPNSCSGWTISHCDVVQCHGANSCQGAIMESNIGIACREYAACQSAVISRSHNVACGMESVFACQRASIEVQDVVLCFGPLACTSDSDQDRIAITVGGKGLLRCGNGAGQLACQNIDVYINHSNRACVAKSIKEPRGCAVICEGDKECDIKSIHFRVQGAS